MVSTRISKRPKPAEAGTVNGDTQDAARGSHGRKAPASKVEAVRMALAAGFGGPQEGSSYIRNQFGLDVSPQHFSSTKSQLKSKEGAGNARPGTKAKPGRKPKAKAIEGYVAPPSTPAAGEFWTDTRRRSATRPAVAASVPASRITNSSPPIR